MTNETIFACVIGLGFGLAVGTHGEAWLRVVTVLMFGAATCFLYDPYIGLIATSTYIFLAFCPLCYFLHLFFYWRWHAAQKEAAKVAMRIAGGTTAEPSAKSSLDKQASTEVGFASYPWHPAAWGFTCVLPFPGLDRLLVAYAKHDRIKAEQAIERLRVGYRTHRVAAMLAEVRMVVAKLEMETNLARLAAIAQQLPVGEGKYGWQPRLARAKIGRVSAQQEFLDHLCPRNQGWRLREGVEPVQWEQKLIRQIEEFQQAVQDFRSPLTELFQDAAEHWKTIALREIAEGRNHPSHP